jgi:hypothetical protein
MLPPIVAALPIAPLKPYAIDIRVNIDPVHWFLSPAKDTRSSLYLEDAATDSERKRPHENSAANTSRPLVPLTMSSSNRRQARHNLEAERTRNTSVGVQRPARP